jgi:hypothetical protein
VIDNTDFTDQFTAKLNAVEAEFAEVSTAAAAARKDLETAEAAAFAARLRYSNFVSQLNQAARDGAGALSNAMEALLAEETRRRDNFNTAAVMARNSLGNLEHRLDCLRVDIGQLRRAIDPPVIQLEVAPRPTRPPVDAGDDIVMPSGGEQAA